MDRADGGPHSSTPRPTACARAPRRHRDGRHASLAGALASVVLVFFLAFFLVKDGRRMWTWLLELAAARRRRDAVNEVGERDVDGT